MRNKVARRLFALFIACAVVPIGVAAVLAAAELRALSERRADERLGDVASTYGMALLGRFLGADDVLRSLTGRSALPGPLVSTPSGAGRILAKVDEIVPDAARPESTPLPDRLATTPAQRDALARGNAVLLFRTDGRQAASAYIVRQTPSYAWTYGVLDSVALWPAGDALPESIHVAVLDANFDTLFSTDPVDAELKAAAAKAIRSSASSGMNRGSRKLGWSNPSGPQDGRYWEVFLRSQFATPSLYVIAYAPRATPLSELGAFKFLFPAVIALVISAVIWLSISQIRRQMRPLEALIEGTQRLARRDFSPLAQSTSDDEFGELARAFSHMASSLQQQFATLESMAEIDRLLLQSPDLESVLDLLLPRVAHIVCARAVSVMLFDQDSASHARLYDYVVARDEVLAVRRVEVDASALAPGAGNLVPPIIGAASSAETPEFAAPLLVAGAVTVYLHPLRHAERIVGFLCVGFSEGSATEARIARAREFSDRLAVVLANLDHETRLYRQAHFDPLTGLPNRQLFRGRIALELERCRESGGRGALLYIDLDHFKRVNDTAGHGAGDELLRVVAQRLVSDVKEGDTVARLGGDEFAVVLHRMQDNQIAHRVCERILASLAEPIHVNGRDHFVTASIGITVFPDDGSTVEELLKHGDVAMYRAKDSGRGRAVLFELEMHTRMLARATLETGMHRALRQRQFAVAYQPIVRCPSGEIAGVEALVRWPASGEAPARSPTEFIPAAEESGLIIELGDWVLETALKDFACWNRQGNNVPYVSVNASARQLQEPRFVARVNELLSQNGVGPRNLQIEITETALAEGMATVDTVRRLAALGIRIALDDFGTGYSSLSHLRSYPIDTVKIDHSFIEEVPWNGDACKLVETILLMGRSLNKEVIAEGVETDAQLDFLVDRGCCVVQGYLLAKPMAAPDISRHAGNERDAPIVSNVR